MPESLENQCVSVYNSSIMEKPFYHVVVGDIATNCWIYPLKNVPAGNKRSCAVIDPGGEADRIIAQLERLKLIPAYILLTHGHFDHIAAVPQLAAKYRDNQPSLPANGKNCEIFIHSADSEYLGPNSIPVHCRSLSAAGGNPEFFNRLWEKMPQEDKTLTEGDTVGPFTVLHLPGHTPGSVGFWDQKEGVLFSGDTLFCGNYGRTDLPGGNEEQIFSSLRCLFALDSGIRVFPGHGPSTTIEKEAQNIYYLHHE